MRRPHIYIYITLAALAAAPRAASPHGAYGNCNNGAVGGVATAVDIRPQVALGAV
jgi:hypothetical protein